MAEIRPFQGLLYDGDKIDRKYADVMAPPYDVISDDLQDELYKKNAHNIIRLILGKEYETNGAEENRYTRAGKLLAEWQKEGVIKKDVDESIYIYVQEYAYKGKEHRRIGFMALMKIDDSVLPHEYTLSKPKKDRMNLIKEVKGNLSPIFSLYEDRDKTIKDILEKSISGSDPVINIEIDGQKHKLWRFSDANGIGKIMSRMKDGKTFIADGHHRFEVARTYCEDISKTPGYKGRADHIMMYFTDLSDEDNLTVVATHRVIKKMPQISKEEAVNKLGKFFEITECDDLNMLVDRLEKSEGTLHNFGFLINKQYFFLKAKNSKELMDLIEGEKTNEWKELDVSVLHLAVFERILSVSNSEGNLTYVKTPESADSLVKSGDHETAFLLNPTRVGQLKSVAELREMMPQKSTYFFPKLLSGLVINKFDE